MVPSTVDCSVLLLTVLAMSSFLASSISCSPRVSVALTFAEEISYWEPQPTTDSTKPTRHSSSLIVRSIRPIQKSGVRGDRRTTGPGLLPGLVRETVPGRVPAGSSGGSGASGRAADTAVRPAPGAGTVASRGKRALSRTAGPGRRRGPPAARRRSAGWRGADARSGPRGARWRPPRWSGRPGCAAGCRRAPGSGPRRR